MSLVYFVGLHLERWNALQIFHSNNVSYVTDQTLPFAIKVPNDAVNCKSVKLDGKWNIYDGNTDRGAHVYRTALCKFSRTIPHTLICSEQTRFSKVRRQRLPACRLAYRSVVVLHNAEQVFNKAETWNLINLYLLAT